MEEKVKKILEILEKKHSGLNNLYSNNTHDVPMIRGHKMGWIDKPTYGVHKIQWSVAGARGFVTIWKTRIIGTSIFITKNNENFKISVSRRKSFLGKLFSKNYTNNLHSYFEKELNTTMHLEK
jgi:hypothetical protein